MNKINSNRSRALRNLILLILLLTATVWFSGLPIPIPELQFRREEKAHLLGPSHILGIEEIDFSYYKTMIVAETDEGVVLWVSGHEINRSNLVYREKNGGNLLLASPPVLGYMTIADEIRFPLVLFDRHPKATRAEIQFTLSEIVDGEAFEKTYFLSAERHASGYFLFNLTADLRGMDDQESYPERLALQIFSDIFSGPKERLGYEVPIRIWFYDGKNTLITEETVVIS